MKHWFIKSVFLAANLSTVVIYAQTPTDEELRALERQIEQQETEQTEEKRKAEAETAAKKKARAERQRKEEEETAKQAAEERRKQEEATVNQAAEERRKQEEEQRKTDEAQINTDVQKSGESGSSIQGKWHSTEGQGDILFVDTEKGKVRGVYRNILYSGEIEGDIRNNTLAGYWSQTISRQSCLNKRDGNQYWGRLQFTFDAEFKKFTGKWGYCDDEPSLPWDGTKAE